MLAAWTPFKEVKIEPDVFQNHSSPQKIKVRTTLPERTFWEKAVILHGEANRPENLKMPPRYARHYYDLYCLANSAYKDSALEHYELLSKVVVFNQKFYPRKWAKYEQATLETIKLLPPDFRFKEIKQDFNDMREMFFGPVPDFNEIMTSIKNLEQELDSALETELEKSLRQRSEIKHSY